MATVTLNSVLDTWPATTTVSVYPQSAQSAGWDRSSSPSGSATTTGVVAAGGSVAFTGLADDTAYVAAAQVSSVWRVRFFRSSTAPTVVTDSAQRAPSQNGLKAWTGFPEATSAANSITAGRTYWVKTFCGESITFSTIWWHLLTAGSGGTPAAFILGVAAQDGTLLGRTSDQSAKLTTAGENSATLTAESGQSLAHPGGAGAFFWLGFVNGTANTTPAAHTRLGASVGLANLGLGAAQGVKRSGYSTASGATTLATFTPSSMFADFAWVLAVS